jgi:DNA polymerase-1
MKNVIVKSFCEENGSISIDSACAESDDIIAVLTRRLTNAGKYVIIVSSDRDMVQLCNDHVVLTTLSEEVRNPKRELLKLTKTKEIDEDITPGDFLLFKIILGDPSDSIPSIKRGVGPKTALKIILDKSKKQLKNLMKEDNIILESFKRNKALIAMSEIPSEITSSIIEKYDNIISEQRNA